MASSKSEKAGLRGATKWSAEQAREFEKITAQSNRLGERLKAEDFDKEGNPVGAWAKVLAELDAWTAKYKVEVKTTEHESREARSAKPGEKPETRANACPGTTNRNRDGAGEPRQFHDQDNVSPAAANAARPLRLFLCGHLRVGGSLRRKAFSVAE